MAILKSYSRSRPWLKNQLRKKHDERSLLPIGDVPSSYEDPSEFGWDRVKSRRTVAQRIAEVASNVRSAKIGGSAAVPQKHLEKVRSKAYRKVPGDIDLFLGDSSGVWRFPGEFEGVVQFNPYMRSYLKEARKRYGKNYKFIVLKGKRRG